MKQRRNPLSHLGWLGLLGILGILSGAVTMLVFFLFFFFFTYRAKVPDELFWANVHKAATRTLAVNMTLTCLVILGIYARGMRYRLGIPVEENGVYLVPAVQWKQALLFAGFANWVLIITICTFVFTLMYLNHRERRFAGPEDDPC